VNNHSTGITFALLAISPFQIHYARNRMYSLMTFHCFGIFCIWKGVQEVAGLVDPFAVSAALANTRITWRLFLLLAATVWCLDCTQAEMVILLDLWLYCCIFPG
jgi:hypothetical protein